MSYKLTVVDGLNLVIEGVTESMIQPGQEWYDEKEGDVLNVTEVSMYGDVLMITFFECDSCVVERLDSQSFLELAYLIVAEDATADDLKI
jgi:hypothetical protein